MFTRVQKGVDLVKSNIKLSHIGDVGLVVEKGKEGFRTEICINMYQLQKLFN